MTATPEIIPTDLTLEIDDNLSPERFMAVARAFFGYVQDISDAIALEGNNIAQWIVRVREGSSLLAVDPTPNVPDEVVQLIYNRAERGIRRLADGDLEDSGLPEPALRDLRTLSEIAEGTHGKFAPTPMRLWVRRKPISVEPSIARVIREDQRTEYNDFGTIEGRLETIQENYGGGLQFQIRDAMLRQKVRCYFPEDLLQEVFETFRKRVEVSGVIRFRKNGMPVSINAERIEALPDDSELPTAMDVRGILRN